MAGFDKGTTSAAGDARGPMPLRRTSLLVVVVAVAIVAAAVVLGIGYLDRIQAALWSQTVDEAVEVASQSAKAFEVFLESDRVSAEHMARLLGDIPSSDAAALDETLGAVRRLGKDYTVVPMPDGLRLPAGVDEGLFFSGGEAADLERVLPSGASPTLRAASGSSQAVGLVKAATFSDGVRALVFESVPVSVLAERFDVRIFDGAGDCYVVDSDGDVVLGPIKGQPMRSVYKTLGIGDDSVSARRALQGSLAGDGGEALRLDNGGEELVAASIPLQGTNGWSLLAVAPEAAISDHAGDVVDSSVFVVALCCGAGVLLAVFLLIARRFYSVELRQRAESERREELFDRLARRTDDVFVLLDKNKRPEYVSPNIERLLGISVEEALRRPEVLWGDAKGAEPWQGLGGSGDTCRSHTRVNRATGESRVFLETLYHAEVDAGVRDILVLSDRTADYRREELLKQALRTAQEANGAKSLFLSNVSHDIRTPMHAICGLTKLLSRDKNDPEAVAAHTAKIAASSDHMLALVNEVLDMSKIESGEMDLHDEEFSLEGLVGEVAAIVRPQAEARSQDFAVGLDGTAGVSVLGDPLRLRQVLLNVVGNAVKYTPEGGRVRLGVQARAHGPLENLRFTVVDNGVGMGAEAVEHAFDPFWREVNSTTNAVLGTGLGLAITKSIVDLMGGAIMLRSAQGVGTTVMVQLGLRRAEAVGAEPKAEEPAAGEVLAAGPPEAGLKGLHFLAAEDNLLSASILEDLLDMEVATVELAHDGREALELFRSAEPGVFDAILMDMQMPVMNGIEAARAIRASGHPDGTKIAIIALTANAFVGDVRSVLDAGMDVHLAKPLQIELLGDAAKKAKDKHGYRGGGGRARERSVAAAS